MSNIILEGENKRCDNISQIQKEALTTFSMEAKIISREKIEDILSIYKQEHIYLEKAEFNGDGIKGLFRKSPYPYIIYEVSPYIPATMTTLYLAQLTYVLTATLIEERRYDILENITLDDFKRMRDEGRMYFVDTRMRFKKEVPNRDYISINMQVLHKKRTNNNLYCKLAFNIQNSIFGEIITAMVL